MARKIKWIIGVDEAGRGPLAGPITLAMVRAPAKFLKIFKGIKDSKHLSSKARKEWLAKIKTEPKIFFKATSVGPKTIDHSGLSKAVKIGIKRLLKNAPPKVRIVLDGGLKAPETFVQKTIIKGDERVPIIAAASIVAKVTRDRKMIRLANQFPQFSFDVHKGYGTKYHYKMLKKHGPSEIHRRSFLTKIL